MKNIVPDNRSERTVSYASGSSINADASDSDALPVCASDIENYFGVKRRHKCDAPKATKAR